MDPRDYKDLTNDTDADCHMTVGQTDWASMRTEEQRQRNRDAHHQKRARGLCHRCSKPNDNEPKWTCTKCVTKRRESRQEKRTNETDNQTR